MLRKQLLNAKKSLTFLTLAAAVILLVLAEGSLAQTTTTIPTKPGKYCDNNYRCVQMNDAPKVDPKACTDDTICGSRSCLGKVCSWGPKDSGNIACNDDLACYKLACAEVYDSTGTNKSFKCTKVEKTSANDVSTCINEGSDAECYGTICVPESGAWTCKKNPIPGSTKECDSNIGGSKPCYHKECRNMSCVNIQGASPDPSKDCVASAECSHLDCVSNKCKSVAGFRLPDYCPASGSNCNSNKHLYCDGFKGICKSIDAPGKNSCFPAGSACLPPEHLECDSTTGECNKVVKTPGLHKCNPANNMCPKPQPSPAQ